MPAMEAAASAAAAEDAGGASGNTGAAFEEMTEAGGGDVIITPGAFSSSSPSCAKLPEPAFHPDGNREIRSMILAALPMPPMPILACKELQGEQSFVDSDLKAISSHDLIAHLMNISCTVVCREKNEERKQLQWKIQEDLFRQLDEWQAKHDPKGEEQLLPPPEFGYGLLGEITRLYIQSYMPDPTNAQDVRFLPAEDIDKSHVVWKRTLEFQKAQDVLYGPCTYGKSSARNLKDMEYRELVQHSVRRMLASSSSAP